MKVYKIYTFGCFVNQNDSKKIMTVLDENGWTEVSAKKPATLYIFNACSVRQLVTDKIFRKIVKVKNSKKNITIAVTGCVLRQDMPKFKKYIDFFFNIKELEDLPKLLESKMKDKVIDHERKDCEYLEVLSKNKKIHSVYIPIMDGCNNFCTYCAVPFVRGREVSRKLENVLREIKYYAEKGTKEIQLLGTNVNSYNPKDINKKSKKNPYTNPFAVLLWEANQISGIEKICFQSPHPRNMHDESIDALRLPKMAKHIHLPVQSGDNDILKKMNRKYTREWFLEIVKKIKKTCPEITITTDIIVGFPGETESQFKNTVALCKKVKFDMAHVPTYSERNGTVASKIYKDDISRKEKKRRQDIMENLLYDIAEKKNKKFLGKTLKVLVDSFSKGYAYGDSQEMKRVKFKGNKNLIVKIVRVKIMQTEAYEFAGKLIN